jgi:hypothetical protein
MVGKNYEKVLIKMEITMNSKIIVVLFLVSFGGLEAKKIGQQPLGRQSAPGDIDRQRARNARQNRRQRAIQNLANRLPLRDVVLERALQGPGAEEFNAIAHLAQNDDQAVINQFAAGEVVVVEVNPAAGDDEPELNR